MLYLLIGALIILFIGVLIYAIFFGKKKDTLDGEPPDDIYPLW